MTRPPMRHIAGALVALIGIATLALASSILTVTATIADYNGTSANTLQSDGGGSYSSSGGVTSRLDPNTGKTLYYQWNLLLSNTTRSFYVTLIPTSPSYPTLWGRAAFSGYLHSRCLTSSGGDQNWTQIAQGFSDTNCAMRINNFSWNGTSYTLVMAPDISNTGTVTVTCTKTSKGQCVAWTAAPTQGGTSSNIAVLQDGSGNTVGYYTLTFNITLTNP